MLTNTTAQTVNGADKTMSVQAEGRSNSFSRPLDDEDLLSIRKALDGHVLDLSNSVAFDILANCLKGIRAVSPQFAKAFAKALGQSTDHGAQQS